MDGGLSGEVKPVEYLQWPLNGACRDPHDRDATSCTASGNVCHEPPSGGHRWHLVRQVYATGVACEAIDVRANESHGIQPRILEKRSDLGQSVTRSVSTELWSKQRERGVNLCVRKQLKVGARKGTLLGGREPIREAAEVARAGGREDQ